MAKRNNIAYKSLKAYADKRSLEFFQYSPYHYRLIDSGFTVVDIWSTRKYYIKETNYYKQKLGAIERQGETGTIPTKNGHAFLDRIFYGAYDEEDL